MVLRLCEELEVPRLSRNLLLNAAGMSPAYASRDLNDREMTPVRQAVDWMLEKHDPFPALAMDRHWRLLRLNKSATLLIAGLGIQEGDSLIETLLQNAEFRDAIENFDEVLHHTIVRLQTESAHFGGDPYLLEAVAALQELQDDSYDPHEGVLPAFIPTRYRAAGAVFSFFSTFTQFGTAEDVALSELKIEMMFPADEATRDLLQAML